MRSRCDVISGSLCSLTFTHGRRHTSHTDSILPFRHTLHTHVTRPQATSADKHRRSPPSAGTPAADHAAALWQLCCRIGTTTTIACQVVDSRARYHRVQMATIAERGANAGTARRARDGRRAYPANRHRVCIRTRSCVRRLTISIAIGAAFGYDTRAHVLSRTLTRREASQCAVRPQSGQTPAGVTPRATWCLRGSELVSPV